MSRKPADEYEEVLLEGTSSPYRDADYYTDTYNERVDDVAYYVAVARDLGGPVLEYGTGNGRIALPLARAGVEVVGVDASPTMLASFRDALVGERPDVAARVSLAEGDMRTLKLGRKFPVVFATFNTLLHLYSVHDATAFFTRVREHLKPGGTFVCDLSVPVLGDLLRDPNKAQAVPPFRHPRVGRVKYREYFDYDTLTQVLAVRTTFEPMNGKDAPFEQLLTHRQFFPKEWEAYLVFAGFEDLRVYGDFAAGRLKHESDTMVWHARAPRAPRA